MRRRTVRLDDAHAADTHLLGVPFSQLALLSQQGVAVADGFCVTQEALDEFLAQPSAKDAFSNVLGAKGSGERERAAAVKIFRESLSRLPLPWELELALAKEGERHGEGTWLAPSVGKEMPVFAPAKGKGDVVRLVRDLWIASLDPLAEGISVPIAALRGCECETSGTASMGKDGRSIEVQAIFGLPHGLQDRRLERDRYNFALPSLDEKGAHVAPQGAQFTLSEKGVARVGVSEKLRQERKLDREEAKDICRLLLSAREALDAEPAIIWGVVDDVPTLLWVIDTIPHPKKAEKAAKPADVRVVPDEQWPVIATSLSMTGELGNLGFSLPSAVQGLVPVRTEMFVLAELGSHPMNAGDSDFDALRKALADGLAELGRHHGERTVVVSLTDLGSPALRATEGGERHEPMETNPYIGMRGTVRHLSPASASLLDAELGAIADARSAGARNISILLPFVRGIDEAHRLIARAKDAGLERTQSFKILLSADVPGSVFLAEEYALACDGIVANVDHLRNLISAIDPGSPTLRDAGYPQPEDESLRRALLELVSRTKANGKPIILVGEDLHASRHLLESCIRARVDGVSTSYPRVLDLARTVAGIEQKILLEGVSRAHGER